MLKEETLKVVEPIISGEVANLIKRRAVELGQDETPDPADVAAIADFAFYETLRRIAEGDLGLFVKLVETHVENSVMHVLSEIGKSDHPEVLLEIDAGPGEPDPDEQSSAEDLIVRATALD